MLPTSEEEALRVAVGHGVLGLTLSHQGMPLNLSATSKENNLVSLEAKSEDPPWTYVEMPALDPDLRARAQITTPLSTGIISIDALSPLGLGQSMLCFGGKGLGKVETALEVKTLTLHLPLTRSSLYSPHSQWLSRAIILLVCQIIGAQTEKSLMCVYVALGR